MCKKDYLDEKKPLTIDELIGLLIARGLLGDEQQMRHALSLMTYYHFSGFCFRFYKKEQCQNSDEFIEGTNISNVMRRYQFDLELRHLLFKAIDLIETYLRRMLVEKTSLFSDPFYYAEPSNYSKWKEHSETIESIEGKARFKKNRSGKELFVVHFEECYSNEHLPMWMAAEFMDFGDLTYFIKYSCKKIKSSIAKDIGLPEMVLDSFLRSLNTLRNACAHHSRIWDKEWGTRPMLPNRQCDIHWYSYFDNQWRLPRFDKMKHSCGALETSHIGLLIFFCRYFLRIISPVSNWHNDISELFDRYHISIEELQMMGLPDEWRSHPIWVNGK